jgi:site-specific DNA-methyltransferase (cytosine-N4-specific)
MIADDLAHAIAEEVMTSQSRVLDPFCGTGRTLLAGAYRGVKAVGVDVNPLALLIAEAKASRVDTRRLRGLVQSARAPKRVPTLDLEIGRNTNWFSNASKSELEEIVAWLNRQEVDRSTMYQSAAILSATTREVSYCRNHQWKLHRMSASHRARFDISPWAVFSRRMSRFIAEAESTPAPTSRYSFVEGDACSLSAVLKKRLSSGGFDLIVTSPPYGDSRTTVSYGGISSICLGVLQYLRGLDTRFLRAGEIDRSCLGGRPAPVEAEGAGISIRDYWKAAPASPGRERIERYLHDLSVACREIANISSKKATAVFVVARRNVSGRRLYIDRFIADQMQLYGFRLHSIEVRRLSSKTSPSSVNAMARSGTDRAVATMREEFVVRLHR